MRLYSFNILLITLLLLIGGSGNFTGDNFRGNLIPSKIQRENSNGDFNKFISGVKAVYVETDESIDNLFADDSLFYSKYFGLLRSYLTRIGFETIAITEKEQDNLSCSKPLNETATFKIILDYTQNYISEVSVNFVSCNGDLFSFSEKCDYYKNNGWNVFLENSLLSIYNENLPYNPENRFVLNSKQTRWNETLLTDYLKNNETGKLEGIYEKFGVSGGNAKYKIAIVKDKDLYNVIYLGGAANKNDWIEGELKGSFKESAIKNFFRGEWILSDKSLTKDVYLSADEENFLKFEFMNSSSSFSSKYLKIFPTGYGSSNSNTGLISSGTGFMVSQQGYIVTNYHVVAGSNKINVEFRNSDSVKTYGAGIVFIDARNDLAVLDLENFRQKNSLQIPFNISDKEFDPGTEVFTLGFPMIETMGESIKLNNGIISSSAGYMGDKRTYQVSVPVNPGNSGGPLFDYSGNLIGIVNAKNNQAENVSYAIKSPELIELLRKTDIETPENSDVFRTENSMAEKVKILNDYVCLIKVY